MKFKSNKRQLEISDEALISLMKIILRYGLYFVMCLMPFANDIKAIL